MNLIDRFTLRRFEFPRRRPIGDSQIRVPDVNWVGAIELGAGSDIGLGFFTALLEPLPPAAQLRAHFENALWPGLLAALPEALLHRVSHPRGGQVRASLHGLEDAAEDALWDLAAKRAGAPLYRYLGGRSPRVEAYASGLCYHLPDTQAHAFYAAARAAGYRAAKLKLGHPDPAWDLARARLVADAMGPGARLMIDANEAWAPKEARARLTMLAGAGIAVHWAEDPLPRRDFAGLRDLRADAGPVLVNSGEYLGEDGRAALIEAQAVDIVSINGSIGGALRTARLCVAKNRPMTIGNSMMNIGAHVAAALPDLDMAEDSQLDWNDLVETPIPVVDGAFILPDRPGHGLALCPDAMARFGGS